MNSNQNEYTPESKESPGVSQATRNPKDHVDKDEKKETTNRPGTQDYGKNVDPDNAENGSPAYDRPNKLDSSESGKDGNDTSHPDGTGDDEPGRRKQLLEKAIPHTGLGTDNIYVQKEEVQISDAPDPEIKNDNTTGRRGLKEEGAEKRTKRSLDEHDKVGPGSADGSSGSRYSSTSPQK